MFTSLGSFRKAAEKLYISLICESDRALDLWIDKSADGSIAGVTIGAFSQDVKAIARVKSLANIRSYDDNSPHVLDSAMLDDNSAMLSITGEGCIDKALGIVTNPYLGNLTYSGFSHDARGLYGYWDNKELSQLHQKIAEFVKGDGGDRSREYLRNRDRFVVYNKLNALFGKSSVDTARAFRHESVDRISSFVGRVQRLVGQRLPALGI